MPTRGGDTMSRRFTKIICAILSAVVALGILLIAGCKEGHTDTPLGGKDIFTGEVKSNGGFVVEKGNYIYFINGVQTNSAKNDYGEPVRGAVSRISKADYENRNYSNTEIVVPQIAYSGNYNAGIFIYGDSIYYGTPSTDKNSDGVVQYQNLEMQSTKLDRSRTTAPYISFSDASYDYRYVEVDGTVYLIYVATNETYYDEDSGVTNIHSLNTKTGKNTLLVYNVSDYKFDEEDKTNPQIYYTMNVKKYSSGGYESYNQIYTVRADATKANEYDTSKIIGWDKDDDHYVNCGQLVFEGIGPKVETRTPFNYQSEDENEKVLNDRSYSYTLKSYLNGTLVFTRSSTDLNEQYLYTYKHGTIDKGDEYTPITLNEATYGIEGKELLQNGSNADSFKYIFDDKGDIKAVLRADGSNSGISINYVKEDGKLHKDKHEGGSLYESKYFNIVRSGTATILFLDRENEFVYYSQSGSGVNGYSVWRVSYASDKFEDYEMIKFKPNAYSPVQILDVDAVIDWYLPEIIGNQLLFASSASDMTRYPYIMVCDLRNEDGDLMETAEIRELNELYKDLKDAISDFANAEEYPTDKYQNIQNVLNYGFYTQDTKYIYEHQCKVNDGVGDDEILPLSDYTMEEYLAFLTPTEGGKWEKFTATKTVNGKEVYATNCNYYYSLLGKMSSSDKDGYRNTLVSTYLPSYIEEETPTWWQSIGKVGRAFFVLGMCLAGVTVIAAITVVIVIIVYGKKNRKTVTKRRRIRVDTTDDKSIDVYNN